MHRLFIAVLLAGGVVTSVNPVSVAASGDGEKTFKSACLHCHGSGSGLQQKVANLSTEEFKQIVLKGRASMPAFAGNATVTGALDALYSYLSAGNEAASPSSAK